ncbi:MAG: hypothetical protein K6F53_00440 [Lachnospiraceae bacterium]|nr:hypothetical protein [Lachnospiraceae bacterium]
MGKKDLIAKQYLSQNDIFADAFNYYLYRGEQVIRPEDLEEKDPEESALIRKLGRSFVKSGMRDVLKSCTVRSTPEATFVLLGIETQSKVHYTMPVRDLLYDVLNYVGQIDEIRAQKDGKTEKTIDVADSFMKGEHLHPVITLCICFDVEKWDAPTSLMEMLDVPNPRLLPFLNDYKLHLISADGIDGFSKFSSELGILLEFIKYSYDKKKLNSIMKARGESLEIKSDTLNMINTFSSARIPVKQGQGGTVNMGNAWQEIIEDERKEAAREAAARGEKRGKKLGEKCGADMLAKLLKLLEPGSPEFEKALNGTYQVRQRLYKKYNITE